MSSTPSSTPVTINTLKGVLTITGYNSGTGTVTYSYDANQRVHAHVTDERSGHSQEVHVAYEGAGVLSEDQIARRAVEFQSLKIE